MFIKELSASGYESYSSQLKESETIQRILKINKKQKPTQRAREK